MKRQILLVIVFTLSLFVQSSVRAEFINHGDGTVTDTETGLMWQQNTASPMDWRNALVYAEELELAGHSDWRLPDRNELQSLVDYSRNNLAIDPEAFPGTRSSGYWSSTTYANNNAYAWYVGFSYGGVYIYPKHNYLYARAVRGRQSGSLGYLVISPATIDYGVVEAGQVSEQSITVLNDGDAEIAVASVILVGDDVFSISADNCLDQNLAPGANCTVLVSFSPDSAGDYSGSVIVDSEIGQRHSASLTGTGGVRDCAGELGGNAVVDECGVCEGDNSSCADCNGVPNGTAVVDECGVCDGDNSSCADCQDSCVNDADNDFGGDGSADILLRHSTRGQLWLYEMDGNTIGASNNIGGLSPVWNVEDVADFGGDGKADILLRHSVRGQLWLFEMDGNTIAASNNIGGLSPIWDVEDVADFDGDGKADILLRHSVRGQLWLYEMDGNTIAASNNIGGLNPVWDVEDVADLGGDGKADILLRHSVRGQLWLYEMDGHVVDFSNNIGGLNPVWDVEDVADLGGDGKIDILLRHSDRGQLWLYEMDGHVVDASNNIGGLSPIWDVAMVSDFGGDGKADILLRHSTRGQLWLYEMDGPVIDSSNNVGGLNLNWNTAD